MKKTLALVLALVLICGCFMACASGIDPDNPVIGTWTLTRAKAQGMELTASDIGVDMQLTLKANASATLINDGETIDGAKWSFDNNTVSLKAAGQHLYDLVYDGTTLTLTEPESGTDLIFEKN